MVVVGYHVRVGCTWRKWAEGLLIGFLIGYCRSDNIPAAQEHHVPGLAAEVSPETRRERHQCKLREEASMRLLFLTSPNRSIARTRP